MMTWLRTQLRRFRRNEDGVTAIEYGVIIALISGGLMVSLQFVGDGFSNPMGELASAIDSGGASSGDDGEGSDGSDDDSDDSSDDDDSDDHDSDDDDDSDDDSDDD